MKILITGGAGFIASHIADTYIKHGHRVVIIDNLSSGRKEFINPRAKFYKVDIRDEKNVKKIISSEKPDIINHHAAQISVRESVKDPVNDAEINILGLLNLLESARINSVRKIIFASSGGVVYGEAEKIPTKENYTPLVPLSPYGVTKLSSEYYLHYYYKTYGMSYVALRYSNVYGPRQNPHGEAGVVAIFTLKLLTNEQPIINGDGKQTRDYIYVGDIAEINRITLETEKTGLFNVGTGIETNVIDIFRRISGILKSQIKPKFGSLKEGEQKRSCLDTSNTQKKLNWKSKVNLDDGLKETIRYFQKVCGIIDHYKK